MTVDAIMVAWLVMLFAVGIGALMTHIAINRLTEWSYLEPNKFEQRLAAIKEKQRSPQMNYDDFRLWTGEIEREQRAIKMFKLPK